MVDARHQQVRQTVRKQFKDRHLYTVYRTTFYPEIPDVGSRVRIIGNGTEPQGFVHGQGGAFPGLAEPGGYDRYISVLGHQFGQSADASRLNAIIVGDQNFHGLFR